MRTDCWCRSQRNYNNMTSTVLTWSTFLTPRMAKTSPLRNQASLKLLGTAMYMYIHVHVHVHAYQLYNVYMYILLYMHVHVHVYTYCTCGDVTVHKRIVLLRCPFNSVTYSLHASTHVQYVLFILNQVGLFSFHFCCSLIDHNTIIIIICHNRSCTCL